MSIFKQALNIMFCPMLGAFFSDEGSVAPVLPRIDRPPNRSAPHTAIAACVAGFGSYQALNPNGFEVLSSHRHGGLNDNRPPSPKIVSALPAKHQGVRYADNVLRFDAHRSRVN